MGTKTRRSQLSLAPVVIFSFSKHASVQTHSCLFSSNSLLVQSLQTPFSGLGAQASSKFWMGFPQKSPLFIFGIFSIVCLHYNVNTTSVYRFDRGERKPLPIPDVPLEFPLRRGPHCGVLNGACKAKRVTKPSGGGGEGDRKSVV